MVGSENGFAVVDVETTGVGKQDRVIEIAVVLLDRHLRVTDEYETLIDPHVISDRRMSMVSRQQ